VVIPHVKTGEEIVQVKRGDIDKEDGSAYAGNSFLPDPSVALRATITDEGARDFVGVHHRPPFSSGPCTGSYPDNNLSHLAVSLLTNQGICVSS